MNHFRRQLYILNFLTETNTTINNKTISNHYHHHHHHNRVASFDRFASFPTHNIRSVHSTMTKPKAAAVEKRQLAGCDSERRRRRGLSCTGDDMARFDSRRRLVDEFVFCWGRRGIREGRCGQVGFYDAWNRWFSLFLMKYFIFVI